MRLRVLLIALAVLVTASSCFRDRQETALERLQRREYGFVIDDFLQAAKAGDEAAVRDFLTGGMVVDVADRHGQTPFQQAAQEAHARVALVLLEHGADPNQRLRDGRTALIEAVRRESCHLRYVDELLRRGAEAHLADGSGLTALMTAALNGHVEALRLLVTRDAGSRDRALLLASAGGHTACMDLLMDHGAHVNCRSRDGRTPLMFAVSKGHREAALLLLQREAARFALDAEGLTAADQADRLGQRDLAVILRATPPLRQGRTAVHDDLAAPGLENLHGQVLGPVENSRPMTKGVDGGGMPSMKEGASFFHRHIRLATYHEEFFPLVLQGVEGEEEKGMTAVMRLLTQPREAAPVRVRAGDPLPAGAGRLVVAGVEPSEGEPEVLAEHMDTGEPFSFALGRLTEASPAFLIIKLDDERRRLAAYGGDEFAVADSKRRYRVSAVKPHALVLVDVESKEEITVARR